MVGIDDEEDDEIRMIYGNRGEMSFSLEYGGHLIDASSNSVILSARNKDVIKKNEGE